MLKLLKIEDQKNYSLALRMAVSDCLAKGGMTPEDAIEVIKKLCIADHDDYTDEQIENDVYLSYEMLSQQKGKRSPMEVVTDYIESLSTTDTMTTFFLKDVYADLGFKTPQERTACRVALNRLTGKIIESCGGKSGTYQIIKKKEVTKTKFIDNEVPEFPVRLPLNLNDIVKLHAKNIIIIAGTKSGGKTAFTIKIALENQARIPVVYLNSEMGDEEYTDRMKKWGITSAEEIQFDVIECHKDFHDHITEEKKIFIVDYLEIHDNFYEIAKDIRAIHEKLKDGICIINLQKDPKAALGRGGEFSREKARLYINLDYVESERATKFTITDAKSPKREGVRGAFRYVKIINGCRFQPKDEWHFVV